MTENKEEVKDLDEWIGNRVKIMINSDGYYEGVLKGELNNGLLIESKGKKVYLPYESVIAIEEL
jgi:sporulation protein YlmC with PRC-barrel domain